MIRRKQMLLREGFWEDGALRFHQHYENRWDGMENRLVTASGPKN